MITGKLSGFKDLRRRILAAPAEVRPECEQAVRVEARKFVEAAVKITPPSSAGVTGNKAKKQGESKVEGDIRKVYLSPGLIFGIINSRDPAAAKAFWAAIKGNPTSRTKTGKQRYSKKGVDLEKARRIMQKFAAKFRNCELGPFDGGVLHKKLRDPRTGRVKTGGQGIVLSNSAGLNAYIRRKKGNVGMLGGGFGQAATRLRATIPAWMRRHGSGHSIDVYVTRTDFTIVISNGAPFAQSADMQRRMSSTAKYREGALRRNLKKILDGQSDRIAG